MPGQSIYGGEANIWYFGGGAGLDFNSLPPVPLTNGKLYTEEGCAAISDDQGRLLFYTDGITVWDRTHNPMPNGLGLNGHVSSTQSAIIVPMPGNNTLYYIFTTTEKAGKNGLSYSIVNMTLNSPIGAERFKNYKHLLTPDLKITLGNGDITIKNKLLFTPTSEKLTSINHRNGIDYWIIAHQWNSNAFYVYPLTAEGIGNPIISKIGVIHRDVGSGNNGESIGYLKASPNGKKLASAICYISNNDIEIFDFDNSTGIISNVVNIPTGGYAYGLEFSPDNSKLYVSFLKGTDGIIQYNMNSIPLSGAGVVITSIDEEIIFGALQLGPDGKIYIARTGPYIDVIHNPNAFGLKCKYSPAAVNLDGQSSVYGLPHIIFNSPRSQKFTLGNDTTICSGQLDLTAPRFRNAKYLWSTGKTSNKITVSSTGTYWVKVTNSINGHAETDTINIIVTTPTVVDLGNDTTLFCIEKFTIDAGNHLGANYLWSRGQTSQKIIVSNSGNYWVTVSQGSCSSTDSIKVIFRGKPPNFRYLPEFNPKMTINRRFEFTINDVYAFEMTIYNDKGQIVYHSKDVKQKWEGKNKNGKYAREGIYTWEIKYKSQCSGDETLTKKGFVTLYR
ncbi:MAG: gliding motility-associated C-terminal domain-containing protein [Bacteroidota bacterium]